MGGEKVSKTEERNLVTTKEVKVKRDGEKKQRKRRKKKRKVKKEEN
jgi:hypothetical protein